MDLILRKPNNHLALVTLAECLSPFRGNRSTRRASPRTITTKTIGKATNTVMALAYLQFGAYNPIAADGNATLPTASTLNRIDQKPKCKRRYGGTGRQGNDSRNGGL